MSRDTQRARDLQICRRMLRDGSRSFHAASLLLPKSSREAIVPLYAFCRITDDIVDESEPSTELVNGIFDRLDRIYDGCPLDHPVDRAMSRMVRESRLPRNVLRALIEGYQWEVDRRRYPTLSDVVAYSARVAGAVGVAVTLLLDRRDPITLSRACEMGIAMQLTNIARDVGEDARRGRIYLPCEWLEDEGLDIDDWLERPRYEPAVGNAVRRLLAESERLYRSAAPGIADLPLRTQPAIRAAGLMYSRINRVIGNRGYDSVTSRAVTSSYSKALLLGRVVVATLGPQRHRSADNPPIEANFLIEAATSTP